MAGQPTRRRPECRGRGGSSSLTLPGNQFAVSRRRVAVGGSDCPAPEGRRSGEAGAMDGTEYFADRRLKRLGTWSFYTHHGLGFGRGANLTGARWEGPAVPPLLPRLGKRVLRCH